MYKPTLVEAKGYAIMGAGAVLLFSTYLFSSAFNSLNLSDPIQKGVASEWSLVALLEGFALMLLGLVKSMDMEKWHQEFPRSCEVCGSGMKADEAYDVTVRGYAHKDRLVCEKQKREWRILKPIFLGLLGGPIIGFLGFAVFSSAGIWLGLGFVALLGFSFYLSVWRDTEKDKGVN